MKAKNLLSSNMKSVLAVRNRKYFIFDDKNFTADEMGNLAETISYEILTSISNRIKRVVK